MTTTTAAAASSRRRTAAAAAAPRSAATQLRAKKSKEDLMEKILPLIESVTTAREMVPSDLTLGYDGYVFPGPLTVNEVSLRGGGATECRSSV